MKRLTFGIGKDLIETVRLERERNPQAKAADMARCLDRSREAIRQALVELELPTRLSVVAKVCRTCGKNLQYGNHIGHCLGCFVASEVKDAVVWDYLRGGKATAIQLEHKIGPGVMYRILHTRNVKLRSKINKSRYT